MKFIEQIVDMKLLAMLVSTPKRN